MHFNVCWYHLSATCAVGIWRGSRCLVCCFLNNLWEIQYIHKLQITVHGRSARFYRPTISWGFMILVGHGFHRFFFIVVIAVNIYWEITLLSDAVLEVLHALPQLTHPSTLYDSYYHHPCFTNGKNEKLGKSIYLKSHNK